MSESLTTYRVGKYGLEVSPYDAHDVRGLLFAWEPPSEAYSYFMGVDPTVGVLGWTRSTRTDEDYKHDNAAVEVFRAGSWKMVKEYMEKDGKQVEVQQLKRTPDIQVAEWTGPIDAQDFASICNFIGRLYGGSHEDKQALAIIEVSPGPGWMTQREMHDRFGYDHFYHWLQEGRNMTQRDTGNMGWYSNFRNRRDLWTRSGGHLKRRNAILRSKWLVEEMVACTPDNFFSMTGRAARLGKSGLNDDRVVATMLALWAANEWVIGAEPTEPAALTNAASTDWQNSAMTAEDLAAIWDARVQELQD